MIIAVCVKQVPMLIDLRFDAISGRMIREGVRLQSNPLDNIAVLTAVGAGASVDGVETVAVTMGPPQAEAVLRHALGLGADHAVLICDPAMAGSDTFATAQVLVAAVQHMDASVVVLGRHSIDAETGQTGAMVAGLLGWPLVSAVRRLQLTGDHMTADRDTDDGIQTVDVALPAVITVAESAGVERWPSAEERERAARVPIEAWNGASLGLTPDLLGAPGSRTSVGAVRPVASDRLQIILDGEPAEAINALCSALLSRQLSDHAAAQPAPRLRGDVAPESSVWAVMEAGSSGLRHVSQELVAAAAELAGALGGAAVAVALGTDAAPHVAQAGAWGADSALALPDAGTCRGDVSVPAAALRALIHDRAPAVVLLPSTTWGRDLAGIVCAQLGLGLTGDAIGFEVLEGRLLALKPALGGALLAPIASSTTPVVATVRSGALEGSPVAANPWCRIEVIHSAPRAARVVETSFTQDVASTDLTWAPRVFCAGMGLGEDAIGLLQRCAAEAGAAVAATRRVCEAGWLPRRFQVGLTGHSISPQLYVGAGVRGAFEHLTGIRRATTVVAINSDPSAPIFGASDYGIVGDVRIVLPLLARRMAAGNDQSPSVVTSVAANPTQESC